ncbi:MAG: 4-hydroxy-3-methylbut-2-enyl diphosphate reductase [Bacteroidales bacterium]|nr:4-hydroxy-3-methylbut-2-enyl diphosphate reductase [Bacteroidales bacterium]
MDSQQNSTIEIDSKSGFCFGVINAIQQAEKALEVQKTLYCLGDIVHNGAEVARLNQRGLITISYEQFKELKNCTVLLRAHGEPPETYEIARKNNITIIDATCPVVLALQKKIKTAYKEIQKAKGQILIFGKPGHAEVIGLLGQTENNAKVIHKIEDLDEIDFSKPTVLFSQTTQNIHDLKIIQEEISKRAKLLGNTEFTCFDTICRRVANRESDLKKFAQKFDIIIFVSGKKSSNGKVLFDICKQINDNTYFVSNTEDLKDIPFSNDKTVGICGATSTPKWLMEDIANKILNINNL